jgi:hypothetical protein
MADRWYSHHWEYHVFISHAGEDKSFAHRLRDAFAEIGLRAFVDQSDLLGGDKADVRMLAAVEQAPVGLALLSAPFFQKKWPITELKVIVGSTELLPVLYNISHEDAVKSLCESPEASATNPGQWQEFVRSVSRTTALKNPSTGQDEAPFVQLIVYSAVNLSVSNIPRDLAERVSNPAFALDFIGKLEVAAGLLSQKFMRLHLEQAEEAERWKWRMHFVAEDLRRTR